MTPGDDGTVPMLMQFKDNYILSPHRDLVLDMIDSVDKNGKHKIFVKLASIDMCNEWLTCYKTIPFNGTNPTIELLK